MTAQAGELLVHNGKRVWMQTYPLEFFWQANPPRPYLIADCTAASRGYVGEWEISDGCLYLTRFESQAWKTSQDWVGDRALQELWWCKDKLDATVQDVVNTFSSLPAERSAAVKRSAQIVLVLAERLLSEGKLKPTDYQQNLYRAAVDASWACFTKESFPVTLDTLFPGSNGRALAAWYTAALSIGEGEEFVDESGFVSTFEFTRLIEIRAGSVLAESVRKNDRPAKSMEDELEKL